MLEQKGPAANLKIDSKFQKNADGSGATNYDTGLMEILEGGDSKMTERSINFPTAGRFYMRACADIPPVVPGGIVESDENNNCGSWAEVNVYDGQPDLVASVPTPSDLYIGNTTFYSRITKFAHFITGSV